MMRFTFHHWVVQGLVFDTIIFTGGDLQGPGVFGGTYRLFVTKSCVS